MTSLPKKVSMSQKLIPHIDHAISPKAHTPMYLMHKFWARKPHNVVAEYIEHYSKKGEIILDPFVGSGVTAIEALRLGRKVAVVDLNPIATFITEMTIKPIDLDKFEQAFRNIEKNVKDFIENLYTTVCPRCGKNCQEVYVIWSAMIECKECGETIAFAEAIRKEKKYFCSCGKELDRNNIVSDEIYEMGYACETCLTKSKRKVRFLVKKGAELAKDKERIKKTNEMEIPYWIPKDVKLYYPSSRPFIKRERNKFVIDLFDRRSLIAHSVLLHEIEQIKDKNIRDIMKLVFTSNLHNVSKLNPVHQPRWNRGQHPSTSWIVHSFWVPPLRVELPAWFYFEERFNHILEGKKETNSIIRYYKPARNFNDLKKGKNILILTQSALNLREKAKIGDRQVSYVFTDPPYGGSIQYLELSTLWLAWLRGKKADPRFDVNFEQEITLNDSQDKDFDTYHRMLRNSFEEVFEVLESGKWLTVTFHNTKIKIFNSIIKAVVLSGFDLEKIIYQPFG